MEVKALKYAEEAMSTEVLNKQCSNVAHQKEKTVQYNSQFAYIKTSTC